MNKVHFIASPLRFLTFVLMCGFVMLSMGCGVKEVVAPDTKAAVPSAAILFELDSLNESVAVNADLLDGRVVYLDFWASWCAPCIYSLPILNDLRNEYKADGFEIVSVNVDADVEKANVFIDKFELDYPVIHDLKNEVMRKYDVTALPTGILINADSEVVLVHQGFAPGHENFLEARIERELRRMRLNNKVIN